MAFVVDGADWAFDGWTLGQFESAVEGFLAQLADAMEQEEQVWIGDDLQSRAVFGGRDLWSLRDASSALKLDEAVWQELAAHMGRSSCYLDEQEWPPDFENTLIAIGNDPSSENADAAWAHHSVRAGKAIGCIGLVRKGRFATSTTNGLAEVHWIHGIASKREFWRDAIDVEGGSIHDLERLSHLAYPDLYFFGNVIQSANGFAGGYYAIAHEIKRYLAVLNDHACWIFMAPPPDESGGGELVRVGGAPSSQLIQRRFELAGLNVAPENPNVFKDRASRTARQVSVSGRVIYCEWHCKLEPHRNRIHIHAPVRESGGKVVVALFAEHLPLP